MVSGENFVARVPTRRRTPKADGDVSNKASASADNRCIAASCRVRRRKCTVTTAADAIRARSAHPESPHQSELALSLRPALNAEQQQARPSAVAVCTLADMLR